MKKNKVKIREKRPPARASRSHRALRFGPNFFSFRILVSDSGENTISAPSTLSRIASNSAKSVLPGVNASHQGRNSRVTDVRAFTNALAWDLAAEDEPMN